MKKNFLYNFLLTGSNFLFPLLTFPYLTRILGAEGLGICNFIVSYGKNYMIIAALGIPVYGIREIAKVGKDHDKRSTLFYELVLIHLVFTIILLVGYISSIYMNHDLQEHKLLVLLGGSMLLFNVFSIEWLFTGVSDFKYITIRSVLIRALSVVAIFTLVKRSSDIHIYFLIIVITMLATVLVDLYSARKYISGKIRIHLSGLRHHLKGVATLGIYMVLTSMYAAMPATLLGFLSTKVAVGYYYGADRIIRMVISAFSALVIVLIPPANQMIENKQNDQYLALIQKSLSIVITIGIPASFLVYLLAEPIVLLLAGESFIHSIHIIRIMAPVILIVAFAQVFVLLILSVFRKDKEMVWLSALGMVVSLVINLIFIPGYGALATGYSQLIAEVTVTLGAYYYVKTFLKFDFPTIKLVQNIIFVIPFAFITGLCMKFIDGHFATILVSLISIGIYYTFYQFLVLKDKVLLTLLYPHLKIFTR